MSIDALAKQKIGCAVEFDGSTYFDVKNADSLNPKAEISLITLCYFTGNTRGISMNKEGFYRAFDYTPVPNRFEWDLGSGTGWYIYAIDFNPPLKIKNNWICIFQRINWLNGWAEIYFNTSLFEHKTFSGRFASDNDKDLYIGCYNPNAVNPFYYNGLISLNIIYGRVLSISEFKNILYNYPNIPTKDLVLWLDARTYDESAGKWYDLSGKGNHATAYGNPTKVSLKRAEVIVK